MDQVTTKEFKNQIFYGVCLICLTILIVNVKEDVTFWQKAIFFATFFIFYYHSKIK